MKSELSEKELAVLTYASQGCTDEMVARRLGIKSGTVNSYWVRIRGKMGNLSRSELVAKFVQKSADEKLAEYIARSDAEAVSVADTNQQILDLANAEIQRLRELLAKQE